MRKIITSSILAGTLAFPAVALADCPFFDDSHHMEGWNSMMGWGGGYGILGGILTLAFWAFVVVGIIYLVKHFTHGAAMGKSDKAMDILKERYAKGEITKEEFEARKKDIKNS